MFVTATSLLGENVVIPNGAPSYKEAVGAEENANDQCAGNSGSKDAAPLLHAAPAQCLQQVNSSVGRKRKHAAETPPAAESARAPLPDKATLQRWRVEWLKSACRVRALPVTGKKSTLVGHLASYVRQFRAYIKIQSLWRGAILRTNMRLQGGRFVLSADAFLRTCTNTCDFNTLDELDVIESGDRFAYADDRGFVYGFIFDSFMQLTKQRSGFLNPYDRSDVPFEAHARALTYLRTRQTRMTYNRRREGRVKSKRIKALVRACAIRRCAPSSASSGGAERTAKGCQNTGGREGQGSTTLAPPSSPSSSPSLASSSSMSSTLALEPWLIVSNTPEAQAETYQKYVEKYAIDAFHCIDELGHYTRHGWFMDLSVFSVKRYFSELIDIWNYRASLDHATKRNIMPPHGNLHDDIRAIQNAYSHYSREVHYCERMTWHVIPYISSSSSSSSEGAPEGEDGVERTVDLMNHLNYAAITTRDELTVALDTLEHSEPLESLCEADRASVLRKVGETWEAIRESRNVSTLYAYQHKYRALRVIRKFVCAGVNDESKMLGSYYVLGALTLVSPEAAEAMPWLHESFER